MQKQPLSKRRPKKEEIVGSETVLEKIKGKTPWVFGKSLRKPKIYFPRLKLPRLSLPMPSRTISILGIFIVLFVLQTGVVYFIARNPTPQALGATQSGEPLFIYPGLHESFILEGIVASILIILSSMGFIFLYQASKYVYNKKMAVSILAIGVMMILVAFILLQYMLDEKL